MIQQVVMLLFVSDTLHRGTIWGKSLEIWGLKHVLAFFFCKCSAPAVQLSYLYKHRRRNSRLNFRTTCKPKDLSTKDYLLQIMLT